MSYRFIHVKYIQSVFIVIVHALSKSCIYCLCYCRGIYLDLYHIVKYVLCYVQTNTQA